MWMLDVVFFDKYFGDVTRGQTPSPAFHVITFLPLLRLEIEYSAHNNLGYMFESFLCGFRGFWVL
jgi:hypothetical protein